MLTPTCYRFSHNVNFPRDVIFSHNGTLIPLHYHSDSLTLSFRFPYAVILISPHCHSERSEESKMLKERNGSYRKDFRSFAPLRTTVWRNRDDSFEGQGVSPYIGNDPDLRQPALIKNVSLG